MFDEFYDRVIKYVCIKVCCECSFLCYSEVAFCFTCNRPEKGGLGNFCVHMAGSASEDNGVGRSSEGLSGAQRCPSGDSLAEWRSSEQVENGTPSTSPPYWDTDDDDNDCGTVCGCHCFV